MPTDTTPASRALAALDALADAERAATPGPWRQQIAAGDCDAPGYDDTSAIKGGGHLVVDQCDDPDAYAIVALRNAAPALLALARAAVHRADMWCGYVSGASGGDADEEYRAWQLADAALDDATAVLIAALAEPPA